MARVAVAGSPILGWIVVAMAVGGLIILPFVGYGADLERWSARAIQSVYDEHAFLTFLVIGLLSADVLLPVPSSLVSTASGAMLGLWLGTLASVVGMTLGCVGGFVIGRTAGSAAVPHLVGLPELQRLGRATERYGFWVLVMVRAVPVLAEASTVFAGMGGMELGRFLVFVTLSNVGISVVYAAVGNYAAEASVFLFAVAAAALIPVLAGGLFQQALRTLSRPAS